MSNFLTKIKKAEQNPPTEDILVWELEATSEVVGFLSALVEGYEYWLMLRSLNTEKICRFAVWASPYYRKDVEELLLALSEEFDFDIAEPHTFCPDDMAFGIRKKSEENRQGAY